MTSQRYAELFRLRQKATSGSKEMHDIDIEVREAGWPPIYRRPQYLIELGMAEQEVKTVTDASITAAQRTISETLLALLEPDERTRDAREQARLDAMRIIVEFGHEARRGDPAANHRHAPAVEMY